jgi:hypothetical protein
MGIERGSWGAAEAAAVATGYSFFTGAFITESRSGGWAEPGQDFSGGSSGERRAYERRAREFRTHGEADAKCAEHGTAAIGSRAG